MRNGTRVKYLRWKRCTEDFKDALCDEMGDSLTNSKNDTLRACMINIQILDHTLSVVKDWMEKGEGKCGAANATDGPMKDA